MPLLSGIKSLNYEWNEDVVWMLDVRCWILLPYMEIVCIYWQDQEVTSQKPLKNSWHTNKNKSAVCRTESMCTGDKNLLKI